MSLFSDSLGWLQQSMDDNAGETVSIRRGELITGITVLRGSSKPKLYNNDGSAYIELRGVEWLIKPADYAFDGTQEDPLPGDRLVASDGTYVVTPMFGNEPCWRYSNQYKTFIRVHTEFDN